MSNQSLHHGKLCTNNLLYLPSQNHIICAFGSSLTIYDLSKKATLLHNFPQDSPIAGFHLKNAQTFQELVLATTTGKIVHINCNLKYQVFKTYQIKGNLSHCVFFGESLIFRENQIYKIFSF